MKIAISGKSGCGNTTVSKLVAEKLSFRLINYTFHTMAEEQGIDFDEFCKMAENDSKYDIYLDTKQKELASEGECVLGSRLAVWLIEDADLKVFLDAGEEVRAERIHKREGGEYQVILDKTIARDIRDTGRYKNLYKIDNNDYRHVDLLINTEHFRPDAVAEIILSAVEIRRRNLIH
jgi:CMP/dCMP kinase